MSSLISSGPRIHQDRHDDRVDTDRFSRSGRSGDDAVGHLGQIADHDFACDGFAKKNGDMGICAASAGSIAKSSLKLTSCGIERGDLDADSCFAGNGGDDADRFGLQVEGDVVFERFDLLHFDADGGVHFKRGDRRSAMDISHFGFDPKAHQRLFQDVGLACADLFSGALDRFALESGAWRLEGGHSRCCSFF